MQYVISQQIQHLHKIIGGFPFLVRRKYFQPLLGYVSGEQVQESVRAYIQGKEMPHLHGTNEYSCKT